MTPTAVVRLVIEFATGSLFLYAAVQKWLRPALALEALRALGVPRRKHALTLLAAFEATLGFVLAAGWRLGMVTPLAILTLIVLTAASARLRYVGHRSDCGCMGGVAIPVSPEVRNIVLIAALSATGLLDSAMAAGTPLRTVAALSIAVLIPAGSALLNGWRARSLEREWEGVL